MHSPGIGNALREGVTAIAASAASPIAKASHSV